MKKTYNKAYKIFFVIILFINIIIVDKAISEKYQIEEKMGDLLSPYPTEIFNKLRENPEPELINEVLSSLTTSPNSTVRSNCAIVLQAQKTNPKVIQGLITALETEKEPIVKITISRGLGKIRTPETIIALEKFILTNNDIIGHHGYLVRAEALRALGELGSSATDSLISFSDNSTIMKTNAMDIIGALGATKDEKAKPLLISYMHDSDAFIRSIAAGVVASGISNCSLQIKELIFTNLVSLVEDISPEVRKRVAFSFGNLSDPRAIPYLEKLMKDQYNAVYTISEGNVTREEKKYPVREAAKEALEQLNKSLP